MPTDGVSSQAMEFVSQAQGALTVGKVEEAQKFMHEALTLAPRDADVLTAFGGMLADIGNSDKALLTLQQAVRIAPDTGFEKYLGQLLGATDEADELLCKGIDILKQDVVATASSDEPRASEDAAELASTLSSALCSLAELRMSHADDLGDVADSCIELLEQATAICPENPEPLQALASVQYEQGNLDAALLTLRSSISKWWQPSTHVLDDVEFDEDDTPGAAGTSCEKPIEKTPKSEHEDIKGGIHVHGNHQERDNTPELVQPSYEFRVECCKLLLELDTGTDTALQILDALLCEYDEAPHAWHLLALAHYAGASFEEAEEALQHGEKLLQKSGSSTDEEAAGLFHELRERIEEGKALEAGKDSLMSKKASA